VGDIPYGPFMVICCADVKQIVFIVMFMYGRIMGNPSIPVTFIPIWKNGFFKLVRPFRMISYGECDTGIGHPGAPANGVGVNGNKHVILSIMLYDTAPPNDMVFHFKGAFNGQGFHPFERVI
jgi:hypothetical protein